MSQKISDYLRRLREIAGEKRRLTFAQIDDALPELDLDSIEKILGGLRDYDIYVSDTEIPDHSEKQLRLILVKNPLNADDKLWIEDFIQSLRGDQYQRPGQRDPLVAIAREEFIDCDSLGKATRIIEAVAPDEASTVSEGEMPPRENVIRARLHYANLVARADVGDAEAMFAAGEYQYFDLCWYKSEPTSSIEWFQRAAAQGHSEAQRMLGEIFYEMVEKPDFYRASRYFEMASLSGNEEAEEKLAEMRSKGLFLEGQNEFAKD